MELKNIMWKTMHCHSLDVFGAIRSDLLSGLPPAIIPSAQRWMRIHEENVLKSVIGVILQAHLIIAIIRVTNMSYELV